MMETNCLKCSYLKKREEEGKKYYSCNVGGMIATQEESLPRDCKRLREKKEVQS